MSKNIYIFILLLFIMLSSLSCAPLPGFYSREKVASINRDNLSLLKEGMNKADVLRIMGERKFCKDIDDYHCVENPVRKEIIQLKNGSNIEVLYYFTWNPGYYPVENKECTPLVIKNNILIGWGKTFLEGLIANENN